MHYVPHVDHAFLSVEHIMRDVNNGWLFRYIHANGASMMFIALYIHMFKHIYYGSYMRPRHLLWLSGVIIFLLAGLSLLHLILLHTDGNNNPLGISSKLYFIYFYPYFYVKDLFALFAYLFMYLTFVFFFPNSL